MKYKKYFSFVIVFISIFGLFTISSALTQTNNFIGPINISPRATSSINFNNQKNQYAGSTTVGVISAIKGKVITIESKQIAGIANLSATNTPTWKTTIYDINTSNATMIIKGISNSTIANVKIGDTIMVQGIISGKNITANMIRDIPIMKYSASTSTMNRITTNTPKNNSIINKKAVVTKTNIAISSTTKIISSTTPATNTPPVINTPTQKKPGFWSRFKAFIVRLFGF